MNKKANIVSGLLFWIMAVIVIGLFMAPFLPMMTCSTELLGFTNGKIICLIVKYFPFFLGIMLLIILLVIARGNQ